MNEHQIACFLQVVQTRSFSKAAVDIHITQPAITHQIAMLEKELGVSLFQRTSRGVYLTAAGSSFLPASQNLHAAFRKAYESVKKVFDEDTPFVLGIPRAMMYNTKVYQHLMSHLSEELSGISFVVQEVVGGHDIYDNLTNGIDCIITMDLGNELKNRSKLHAVPLYRGQCHIAMGKKNPLYPNKTVSVEDLFPYNLYYAQYDRHYISVIKKHLPKGNLLHLRETVTPLTVAPELVAGKSCILLPGDTSESYAEHIAILDTDVKLPLVCVFYLKSNTDSVYETVAKIVQRSHLM